MLSPLTIKVAGKMIALLDLSEEARGISLKCDPELAIEQLEQHPEVTPAWHYNNIIEASCYIWERSSGAFNHSSGTGLSTITVVDKVSICRVFFSWK